MPLNQSRAWLIAYDITDPDRLRRVHRFIRRRAVPVQYSVFAAEDTPARMGQLRSELAEIIDPRTDDVRIYPVPANPDLVVLGKRALPDGVLLLRGGSSGLFTGASGGSKVVFD
ncbi:MAG: CRISPR-associated endonuclease Cas2 [Chromatiales bacterium]